ncbi:anti-sigma factor domain-containing protein [Sphingomonas sp. 28-63-12]|uniref:anti-sigma factor n=1 Tax=Sphingomonas sp. 28-63-12 TaxID=1970434 RepID=UPI000BD68D58|nr:MAG: hypothetical protein B7Y47_10800 [Sphingomonas sp. 28-63-12]
MMDDRPPDDGAPDASVMAAELALGLLEGEERAAAQRRVLAEPGFAAEVDRWRAHFGVLFESVPPVAPPADGLARLERALAPPANDTAPRRWWRSLAVAGGIAAAVLLAVMAIRPQSLVPVAPPVQVAQRSAVLVAQIVPVANGEPVPAVYDPATGALRVAAADLVDARHSPELWVIARDGVPHSLGVLHDQQPTAVAIGAADRARFTAGATLAVTVEPIGGSPSGKPTGAVVAKGDLTLA